MVKPVAQQYVRRAAPVMTQQGPQLQADYIVKHGDTLYNIAVAHGLTLDQIIAYNPQMRGNYMLVTGQVVHLSPGGSPVQNYVVPAQNVANVPIQNVNTIRQQHAIPIAPQRHWPAAPETHYLEDAKDWITNMFSPDLTNLLPGRGVLNTLDNLRYPNNRDGRPGFWDKVNPGMGSRSSGGWLMPALIGAVGGILLEKFISNAFHLNLMPNRGPKEIVKYYPSPASGRGRNFYR
jgi:hypothetical protein